jgi:hypothetical protein
MNTSSELFHKLLGGNGGATSELDLDLRMHEKSEMQIDANRLTPSGRRG